MFDNKGRYIIEDYGKKSVFSSFLPGISGKFGIPVWTFYVNRGQGITSFGSGDKDHSIMEFCPAHQAYQNTKRQGFRTFIKKDGKYIEPFAEECHGQKMYVGMNEFEIEECNEAEGLKTNVLYYTLPMENIGGLVREVTFTNVGTRKMKLEVLDGMPALIPYGVSLTDMKEMAQTIKAWMQVEDIESRLPYFKVRASTADSIAVQEIKEGNYSFAVSEKGEKLPVIVDPDVVFSYDTSMESAVGLKEKSVAELLAQKQIAQNNLPCCFFALEKELEAGESTTLYEITGIVQSKEILKGFADKCMGKAYFEAKRTQAEQLTKDLCKVIRTKSGNPIFDAYCEQTYLDNLLRGGYPVKIGKDKIFYLYSRKHGDIERDYNFFQMSPEFYSQGNANFRDVNQNRRCDILFTPYVGDLNVKNFYNLIQTDGYNPLLVQKAVYKIQPEKLEKVLHFVKEECQELLKEKLAESFTPGSLSGFVMEYDMLKMTDKEGEVNEACRLEVLESFVGAVMDEADSSMNAAFGEGYWTDHWTYNLDLVEAYLSVYPDKEEALLFEDASYTYFEAKATVNPRRLRYEETEKGIRQYHTLNHEAKKNTTSEFVCAQYGKGEVYYGNLMEKLLLLCSVKFATLDPYGMGIEMEGGKPGWYDALNGMPGLLGSSMCETYELCRMLEFVITELKKYNHSVVWAKEMSDLFFALGEAFQSQETVEWKDMDTWNAVNDSKETYRQDTLYGLSGTKVENGAQELLVVLEAFHTIVKAGIARALDYGKGISPAYFTYEVKDYEKTADGIFLKRVEPGIMPYFLEGPVRYLKLDMETEEKEEMYRKVKESAMYDEKLQMYKVNAPLTEASFEVGRSKAFTPGWLENESIWLHMEYKYLLELLKSGMYAEFTEDFHKAAVPFLDTEMYGRSPLENSSFIASSANANEKIHGKGFVARLSGSTAEFIQMWQIMMFGQTPFTMEKGELTLQFTPLLPAYLIGEEKKLEAVFLGSIPVTYYVEAKKDYLPKTYEIHAKVCYSDGSCEEYANGKITGKAVYAIRSCDVERIELILG